MSRSGNIFLCALLAILAVGLLYIGCGKGCPPVGVVISPIQEKVYSLPADLVFEYASADLTEASKKLVTKGLLGELKLFKKVRISEIVGYADAIGGTCSNYELARNRAKSVHDLIKEIEKLPELQNKLEIGSTFISRYPEDAMTDLRKYCFEQYQEKQKPIHAPLLTGLSAKQRDSENKKKCDESVKPIWDQFHRKDSGDQDFSDTFKRLKNTDVEKYMTNQRQLIGCLAPMRRVDVVFEGSLKD